MRTEPEIKDDMVVAIACADIHLSAVAPLARSGEPDWYEAMARPLRELKKLQVQFGVPVLCAGDVFHHWKSPPELVNFALHELPTMVAIPGQHDMPNHQMGEMHRSAYETLVRAEKIITPPSKGAFVPDMNSRGIWVYGFPWEVPMSSKPPKDYNVSQKHIALQHAYRWIDGAGHPKATETTHAGKSAEYGGYDSVIIGDNHKAWTARFHSTHVFNCGSLMRRAADQQDHKPRVGLVMESGRVEAHYLNVSKDVFSPSPQRISRVDELLVSHLEGGAMDVAAWQALRKQIEQLDDESAGPDVGFFDALRATLAHEALREPTRKVIRDVIEHATLDQRPTASHSKSSTISTGAED